MNDANSPKPHVLILPLPEHVSDDLVRLLVAELDAIMQHGFGELRIEVENGHADILPAARLRFKYERRGEGERCGGEEEVA